MIYITNKDKRRKANIFIYTYKNILFYVYYVMKVMNTGMLWISPNGLGHSFEIHGFGPTYVA